MDHRRQRRYRKKKSGETREQRVYKWLEKYSSNWIHGKAVSWGSEDNIKRCFPDFRKDYGEYVVIIEVDEHAHSDKTPFDEFVRMIRIREGLGKPCVFIRFNTDVKWYGRPIDYKFNLAEFELRLNILGKVMSDIMKQPLDQLNIIWICYDRFSKIVKKSWDIETYNEFINLIYEKLNCYNHGHQDNINKYIKFATSNQKKQRMLYQLLATWLAL